MAVAISYRLRGRETRATHADGEGMGGAPRTTTTTTLAGASGRCLLGGASLRARDGSGGRSGGRIDVEDKPCVGICRF